MLKSEPSEKELIEAMRELSAALKLQLAQQRNWKLALRNGLLAGLGGVLGATVVVSLLIAIMQPFKRLEAVGPLIERLDTTLKQNPRAQR